MNIKTNDKNAIGEEDVNIEMITINISENEQQPRVETHEKNTQQSEEVVFAESTINCELPRERIMSKWYKYTHFPTFTIIVSIVDVALFIWVLCIGGFVSPSLNPMLGPSSASLLQAGAKWTPYIKAGQWWRLISASYLHAGFIHIIMNLLTQIVLGVMLEKKYGTIRFSIIYVLSGNNYRIIKSAK